MAGLVNRSGYITDINISGNLSVAGFSKVGDAAPKIKCKKLTGTTSSTEGGASGVLHGLTQSKIISFTVIIQFDSTTIMPLNYNPGTGGNQGFEAHAYLSTGNTVTVVNHATNSENILSKPYIVTIWYEE
jgi:hypothetical protein